MVISKKKKNKKISKINIVCKSYLVLVTCYQITLPYNIK